jgi:predicted ATPase
MLFVLDNCEHVIEGAASVALEVLRASPHTRILATGREALRVEGERVHRLSRWSAAIV